MSKFAAILLAAGTSRRMGANKLLLDAGGQPMVRSAAITCQTAGLSPIIAVLGHESDRVGQALAGLPVRCVLNADFATGMASSLTRGLAALPAGTQAALIVLADMPLVSAADIAALRAAYAPKEGRVICIPVHAGKRGNPVLLGRPVFAALAGLAGDQGAKSFILQHAGLAVEVPAGPGVLTDIDTPDAYAAFRRDV
jgi:molybdenum cofactor cytidylyltransferase